MKKYPKFYRLGHSDNEDIMINPTDICVLQEKLDGANFRFAWINDKVIFGSKNLEYHQEDDGGQWKGCIDYIKETINDKDLSIYPDYIFFGECMKKHTINYRWSEMPKFVGYDIFDLKNDKFLHYTKAKEVFEELGLTFVPIIKEIKVAEISLLKEDDIPQSVYYNGQAEGIVIKNFYHPEQRYAKLVREKFKEDNRKCFGGHPKYGKDDDEKVVFKYATNARIEKAIYSLMYEEKMELNMKMMQRLPKMVWYDIITEEHIEILNGNYIINLRNIRKKVADRCRTVLQDTMINNAL